MKQTYRILMERFNWTTEEIDRLDFNHTIDILMDEIPDKKEEPLQFIDQVFGT